MTPAAAGRAPIEHTGSGITDSPAGRRCAFCGATDSYRFEDINGKPACAWCYEFRRDVVTEAAHPPRGRAQLGAPHTAARSRAADG